VRSRRSLGVRRPCLPLNRACSGRGRSLPPARAAREASTTKPGRSNTPPRNGPASSKARVRSPLKTENRTCHVTRLLAGFTVALRSSRTGKIFPRLLRWFLAILNG
jgi:hypothetical protein